MKRKIAFLLVLCLLMSFQAGAFAANTPFYEDSQAIARAAESVLLLTCYDNEGNAVATGSGFLAFEDGIIITNYHVIDGITGPIKANTEDGMYFDINEILCFDQTADVAILKTKAKTRLDLLPLAASSSLGKGSRVVAIGSPLGLLNIVSEGIYSGIVTDETEYILFTAAISSGSSGGALFNENGEVIGVTAATYTEGQNLNLAVPIENVRKLWNQYQSGEYVETAPIEQTKTIEKAGGEEAFLTAQQYYEVEKYSEAVEWYTKAAEQGYAEAQYMLGKCYYDGTGVEKDYTTAVKWFEKASEQENAKAQCWLSICYYYGNGVEENNERAIELIEKAINNGDALANAILGYYYIDGIAVEQNEEKGIEFILKAAEMGDPDVQSLVGDLYYSGDGVNKNDELAVQWYMKASEQGSAEAQYKLGVCYYLGTGVEIDLSKSKEWISKSASRSYPEAECLLGYFYGLEPSGSFHEGDRYIFNNDYQLPEWFNWAAYSAYPIVDSTKWVSNYDVEFERSGGNWNHGKIVDFDRSKSIEYYTRAAQHEDAVAQYNLASCYENGCGVKLDTTVSFTWYLRSAEKGYENAEAKVGYCYAVGQGTEENAEKAMYWFEKAAEQSGRDKNDYIGLWLYQVGAYFANENHRDYLKMIDWYRRAARYGNGSAQRRLAEMNEWY